MNAFCGRITRPYSDLSGVFSEWTKDCEYLFVYEHDADEKVNRTHCHLLLIGSKRDNKGIKNISSYKKLQLKGNEDHSYKKYDNVYDKGHEGEWYEYVKYMTKGKLDYKLAYGHNADVICENSKLKWVEPKSVEDKVVKVDKEKKKDYWNVVLEVREQLTWVEVSDLNSYITGSKKLVPKESYEQVYWLMVKSLEKHKIRAADYELKRWLHTIVRNYSDKLAENILKSLV